jgi:hypothetical protein
MRRVSPRGFCSSITDAPIMHHHAQHVSGYRKERVKSTYVNEAPMEALWVPGSEFLKALISEHGGFFIMFLKRDESCN